MPGGRLFACPIMASDWVMERTKFMRLWFDSMNPKSTKVFIFRLKVKPTTAENG
jgi:hypothetical protein